MAHGNTQAVAACAAAVLAASLGACNGGEPANGATDELIDDGMVLLWHVRTEDCLTCSLPDYSVRRVQASSGEQFRLKVVHVGRQSDESVPLGFLRQRRITPAGIVTMSSREHYRQFPGLRLPALTLFEDGALLWSSTDSVPIDERSITLHERIEALLAETDGV